METQLNELTQMMKALQAQNSSIQRTLDDNLVTLHDVGVWRAKIDGDGDGSTSGSYSPLVPCLDVISWSWCPISSRRTVW